MDIVHGIDHGVRPTESGVLTTEYDQQKIGPWTILVSSAMYGQWKLDNGL